jgi:hypothetical protein
MEITKESIIKYLKEYYNENHKSPILTDINHPFTYYQVKSYFKTWNKALSEAGIPLNRNKIIITQCYLCKKPFNKQFKEIIKSNKDFCGHKCSAIFNNSGRKMSDETKEKIRKKLQLIRFTNCKICNVRFQYFKRKKMTCGDKCLSDLKKLNHRKKSELMFNLLE